MQIVSFRSTLGSMQLHVLLVLEYLYSGDRHKHVFTSKNDDVSGQDAHEPSDYIAV